MIIKEFAGRDFEISELESLRKSATNQNQIGMIERQIKMLKAGAKAESEAAYLLDFALRNSKNTAVIHDLRIEQNGRVAQIDHLLIHRSMKFVVLETKNFASGLKIQANGEFLRYNNFSKTYDGMPSPIEQNNRHIAVLKDVVDGIKMPSGFIFALTPHFYNRVMVSSNARVIRDEGFKDNHRVIKSDQFESSYEKILDGGSMADQSELERVAKTIAALHRPIVFDYRARFGIPEVKQDSAPPQAKVQPVLSAIAKEKSEPKSSKYVCKKCSSHDLHVEYGKFGYYFKCGACDGNTPINVDHPELGKDVKIQKIGKDFYFSSKDGEKKVLFFTNK